MIARAIRFERMPADAWRPREGPSFRERYFRKRSWNPRASGKSLEGHLGASAFGKKKRVFGNCSVKTCLCGAPRERPFEKNALRLKNFQNDRGRSWGETFFPERKKTHAEEKEGKRQLARETCVQVADERRVWVRARLGNLTYDGGSTASARERGTLWLGNFASLLGETRVAQVTVAVAGGGARKVELPLAPGVQISTWGIPLSFESG